MTGKQQTRNKMWLRLASILMALLLWFYVINQGSVESGGETIEVALRYYNLSDQLNITAPEKVLVKLWGTSQDTSAIVAYVDLAGLGKGVYQVPVKIDNVRGAMLTSVQPSQVEVILEELSERVIPIKQEVQEYPQAGYQLSQALLSPDRCVIKGDAETVARVAEVVAPIDIENVIDVAMLKPSLEARDVNGQAITGGIEIVPTSISVYVVVEKKHLSKKVNIKAQLDGDMAVGYTIAEVRIDQDQASILGDQSLVESINEIATQPIDISGKQETFTQSVELVQPEGVSIVPARVNVEVIINKIDLENVSP